MYNNFLMIVLIFFNVVCLFPSGKNESNTIVLAVDEYRGNLPFYVYKRKEQLWISAYQEDGDKKYDIKHFPVKENANTKDVINIQNQYAIYNINNIVFLYTNNVLRKIKIDINNNDFASKGSKKFEIERINDDISNVWFYDKHCFYSDKSGKIFIYNENMEDFDKYEGITLSPDIKNSVMLKTNLLAEAAQKTGNEWFQKFSNRLSKIDITNKAIDEILGNNDKILLNRYKNIFKNSDPGKNVPIDLKMWIANMQQEYRELDKEKAEIRQNFLSKWKINTTGSINIEELAIVEIIKKYCSSWIPRGLEIEENTTGGVGLEIRLPPKRNTEKLDIIKTDKIIFSGIDQNSEIIKFYTSMYNDLIDLERKLHKDANEKISEISKELLKKNYDFFASKIIEELREQIDTLYNAYNELKINFNVKDREFVEKIFDNINNIEFVFNDTEGQNTDYVFLPAIHNGMSSVDSYTIVYNTLLEKMNTLTDFENIGKNINLLGIIDNYIYACDRGNLILYDIFTLQEKDRYELNQDEKILFSINQEKNFFITAMTTESKSDIYYLNKILINNGINFEKIKKNDIIANTRFIENKFHDPFYSCVLEVNSEANKIYVNKKKTVLPFGKGIKTKKGFKYIETPAGAGIILQ
jgi:hypothetical protein